MNLKIRKAVAADVTAIAHLHALSWRNAYKDILPTKYLENNLETEREKYWKQKMAGLMGNDFVFIAEKNTSMVGFVAVMECNEKGYKAIVDNLHVLPEEKGNKVGSILLCVAAVKLRLQLKDRFFLWVLDENLQAVHFYLKMGGRPLDKSVFKIQETNVPETRYCWDNLDDLIKLDESFKQMRILDSSIFNL